MITQLDLYILNNDNSVAPFPSEAEQIVLYDFAFEAQRMGAAPEITATIQANGSLENSLTTKVFCEYNGERYFLKTLPSSAKENTDPRYTFDLTFVSERTILDNVYMIDAVQGDNNIDRYQSNSTNIVFMGTIEECVARLNAAMTYAGVGYSVVLDEGITTESKLVSFQDKFFTEALQEIVNIHNIPYYYVGKVIHFGWAEKEVPRTLKYAEGLVSISKDISNTRIVTRATATGSSENIPYYYPNPTPLGIINPNASASNNGITSGNITLVNPYKFSKLQSNKLQYFVSKASASIIHYAVANIPSAEENIIATPYRVQCEIPHEDYKMAGALVHLSAEDYIDRTVYVEFNHSKLSGDAPINEVRAVEYGVYKFTELDGQIVLTEDTNVNVVFESSALGDFVVIENFPADQERYVMATYYNSSSWDVVIEFNCYSSLSDDELKTSWYVVSPSGKRVETVYNLSDFGLSISGAPSEGDVISIKVEKKIPFALALMPPIYRENNGEQRFYNAINGAYGDVIFENEYDSTNPLEAITSFEDIKPTIVGSINANGERIDMFAEFAYDLYDDDSTITDGEGNEEYVHPYFYAKLHRFDFNLFAQAIESGEMTIEMTSGVCGACKFTIMVDSNTQRNLVMVDSDGNLVYDEATGKVKMADDATGLDRQNDTENYEVWIALKKDINTYGQIMPNVSYNHYPSIVDTFVITNIILPDSYTENAERRLEMAIIDFLVANNKYKFNYSVNISRIYLKKNIDVYNTISENSVIPIEYNGDVKSFYITTFTYRKEKNTVLPDISITLSDSIESTTNSFNQAISAVKIDTQKYVNSSPYIQDLSKMFLRKDMQDTANAPLLFKKQLVFADSIISKDFKSGSANGYGLGLYRDINGLYTIEVDRVLARRGIVGNGVGDATSSKDVVTTNTNQTITGVKTFANGFKMSEGEEEPVIRYDVEKKALIFPMNVLVEGGVAWNSSLDGFDPQTIAQAVKVDWETIGQKEDGTLYVIGGTGGGSGSGGVVGGVTIDEVKNYLTNEGYATQVWVNEQGFLKSITSSMVTSALGYTPYNAANFTKANIKTTLGISDWALASAKPTYTASEVGALGVNGTAANASKLDGVGIHNMFKYYGSNTDLNIFSSGNTQSTAHYILTDPATTNAPEYYGVAVNFGAVGNFQLFSSSESRLYYRQRWAADWGEWSTIAFTSDIPTNLSQLTDDVVSGNYLPINGTAVNSSKLSGIGLANGSGRNGIPTLSETGYMEVGIAMDFHRYDDGVDFSTRLRVANGNFGNIVWLPTSDGTIALTSDITNALASYVTIGTAQNITGVKDFVNGFKIGGTPVTYDASKNAFVFPANAIFEGGVAWNSSLDGFEPQTVTDAVNVDGVTIGRTTSGALTVLAGAGGGINEAQLADYLTNNNYAKESDIPSLSGYATEAFVTSRGYITSAAIPTKVSAFDNDSGYITGITSSMVTSALGYTPFNADNFTKTNIKSTLGISDWALESVKPTYTASEVGALGVNDTAANANKLDGVEISSMFKYYGFNTDLSIFKGGNYQTTTHYINSTDTTITNAPTYYGTAVNFGARVGNFQLFASNTHKLYFRQRWTSDWGDWKQIAFTSDIPTNLSQFTDDVVKGRYLSTSGGTVNGGITATGNVSAQSVIVNRGITAGSVLSFVDTDASEKIVLQRNSGGDILFCGGFADRNVYIDGSILRVRTENTIFSRGISTTGVTLSSGGKSAVISYNASKNAFIFPANAIFEGGVAWNSPMDGTSAYASELERRIEALQTEVDTLKQTVQTLTA